MRVSVQCAVLTGDPPFKFSWYKDGQKILDGQSVSMRNFDDFTFTLVISKVDAESNGNYSCKVSSSKGYDEKSAILSVKDLGEPKIKPFQFSNDLDLGMREAVHCIVTHGNPPFEFSWYKDGHQLTDRPGTSIRKIDDYDSKLVISKLDADSNGNYTCRVTNSLGIDQKSTILSVRQILYIFRLYQKVLEHIMNDYKKMRLLSPAIVFSFLTCIISADSGEPKIKSFHFNRDLKLGMRESVNCAVVDGDPPFEILWFKDGRPLVDGQGISIRKFDDYDSKLAISKVNADSNGFGEPKIKSFHFSNELELGMRESVHCTVLYGDTPFELSWFKDGQLIKDGQGISIRKMDEYHSNLVISNIDADSNGNYTCKVTNIKGSDAKSAILSVKDSERPKIKTFHFSNVLELGMRESVQCTVMSGDSPFEFSWLKDGRPLVDSLDVSIHKTGNYMSTLMISKVNADSNGNYTCRVANTVGFDEKSAVLSVQDSRAPKLKSFQFSNDIELGMREVVNCAVTYGDPPFEFLWFKDGQPLIDSRDISYRKTDEFMSNLIISKVNADSNGNYTCKVTNSVGFDQKSAVLSVKDSGAPRIKPFHFTADLNLGMRDSVHCAIVYGDPPFEFSWLKDGKLHVRLVSPFVRRMISHLT
ncbi:hemicentin-1 [Caerostris darwini]|uniref:Hemicentin-1 n=1 Tax=Caerostris darwini TaxID=1538125 RepID=A0AAV4R1H5_9ARAC|nr:hemicentin-1 [Caerostris darwini]